MVGEYSEQEMQQLHDCLYRILAEIARVCDKHNIPYFIQGGSAIGAYFENEVLAWDDDIDVGLTRENYWRFLEVAPKELGEDFFLQWVETDEHTPFYFAKVRLNNTRFVEEMFAHLPIHHGIYVDVFPFDLVPDKQWKQKFQRTTANFLNACFMGKDIWMWNHCGKSDVKEPRKRSFLSCFVQRCVQACFSKRTLFRLLSWSQSWYNGKKSQCTYYNMVLMPRDHISVASIENPQQMKFGPLTVWAPSDLKTYLEHHYPNLRRYIPKEEQRNHRPIELTFDTRQK